MGKLFLLAAALPLLDLWLLFRIGRSIGFWPAVAFVLVMGVVGAWLARAEGFRVLRSWQASLAAGRLPDEGVLSGVLILVGAALLVLPGIITDVLGLALVFAPTRRLVAAGLRRRIATQVAAGRVRVVTFGGVAPTREPVEDAIDVTPPRDHRRLDS
ncbi:MAG TPA: FxsA family protein [Anaeromyxobacteraceae bacterium]|nr:FxsA family protein [Anaeromyxobacteraceae bacterium]